MRTRFHTPGRPRSTDPDAAPIEPTVPVELAARIAQAAVQRYEWA